MKKNLIVAIFLMLMSPITTAWAENKADSYSLTPFIGGYVFEGNQNSKDAFSAGLRAGYNFTENWGMEGFYAYVPSEFKDTGETNSVYVAGIEGLYNFLPDGRFVPFVAIGVGAFHFSDDRTEYVPTNFAVDYGAGLKFFVTENIALRADVRHVLPLNDRYNDLLCTFGINFAFGGKKKEVFVPTAEEPVIPKEVVVVPKAEEPVAPKEVVVVPKVEEPVAPKEVIVAAAPTVNDKNPAQVSSEQSETKYIPEKDIRNLVNKWLASWQSGDMKTYRSCYDSGFHSKEMTLNAWISYKINVRHRSKNINISIDDLQVSVDENSATAVFTQSYSSSILKDKGKKTLTLRKTNGEWKIYKEIM